MFGLSQESQRILEFGINEVFMVCSVILSKLMECLDMQRTDLNGSENEENKACSRQRFGEQKRSGMHCNEVRIMRLSRDDGGRRKGKRQRRRGNERKITAL